MERLSNTALSDLVGRSVSFLFAKYDDKQKTATVDQDLRRLRQLLLRSGTIVEEADRRLVTNGAMLRQLKDMKDQMLRGYYVLDVVACRAALGGDGRKDGDDEASHRAFSMSIFNPAKRVRSLSGDPGFRAAAAAFGAIGGVSSRELQEKVQSLEAMIGDAKEFVVFLTNCPPLYRQPYSAHLFMERCMFGRYMEKDRVMDFLLQVEPPGAPSPGVLPIVGPAHIGKSTLVEHVCNDERVRNHFSLISFYSQSSLEGEVLANLEANCLIKHQNGNAPRERQLVVIELLEDVNEETWNMMLSSESSISHGSSRIIVTSRSENIVKLGTTHALRLQCLTTEAYWYFFKMAAFGSNDPGEHPKLASLALEMASLMQGSFTFATIGAIVLRENFNTQSWHRAVTRVRDYMQKNVLVNKYHDDVQVTGQPRYSWSIVSQKPSQYFVLRDIYRSDKQNAPDIQFVDLLAGSHQPLGTYEILFWESRIPPYFKYVCKCEIRDM